MSSEFTYWQRKNTKEYEDGYDRIFGKKKKEESEEEEKAALSQKTNRPIGKIHERIDRNESISNSIRELEKKSQSEDIDIEEEQRCASIGE